MRTSPNNMSGHPRLLVAEDEPDVRELLTCCFSAEGFEVLTAADGIEAEGMVHRERPDAVVLDVMMPGRDGLAVLAAMRASPDLRTIPVVLLTARSADSDIWNGWKAGADYYVTKPFDVNGLVGYVRYLVDGSYAAAEGD